jgi:hypothetical protein
MDTAKLDSCVAKADAITRAGPRGPTGYGSAAAGEMMTRLSAPGAMEAHVASRPFAVHLRKGKTPDPMTYYTKAQAQRSFDNLVGKYPDAWIEARSDAFESKLDAAVSAASVLAGGGVARHGRGDADMDAQTRSHLEAWLTRSVASADRAKTRRAIIKLVTDDPDLIASNHSWPELERMALGGRFDTGPEERVKEVWSQANPRGMYAKTSSGRVFKLNAAATGGKIPEVGKMIDPSSHEEVRKDSRTARRDEMDATYRVALEKFRAASQKFREAQRAYRAREIDDRAFLAARATFDEAQREMDRATPEGH